MRILPVADLKNDWYPRNAITLFRKHSSCEFVESADQADVIWVFSYYVPLDAIGRRAGRGGGVLRRMLGRSDRGPGPLVISSFHHLDRDKESEYIDRVRELDRKSDLIHFFSERNIHQNRSYFQKPILLLPYWIETSTFHPLSDAERASVRRGFGLPSDRVVIGSFQRDTERDLRTPKLVKGPDLLCDVLERLDRDRVHVFLAGPRRDYVIQRLREGGIGYTHIGQIPHAQMKEAYSSLDYYLVTARREGGPQAILEAMATRTAIYSTPVGISDLLSPGVVLESVDAFVAALKKPYPGDLERHLEVARSLECSAVVACYERTFAAAFEASRRDPQGWWRGRREVGDGRLFPGEPGSTTPTADDACGGASA